MSLNFGFSLPAYTTSGGAAATPIPTVVALLQEDGSFLLQEDGSKILATVLYLRQEDSSLILQENDSKIYV